MQRAGAIAAPALDAAPASLYKDCTVPRRFAEVYTIDSGLASQNEAGLRKYLDCEIPWAVPSIEKWRCKSVLRSMDSHENGYGGVAMHKASLSVSFIGSWIFGWLLVGDLVSVF